MHLPRGIREEGLRVAARLISNNRCRLSKEECHNFWLDKGRWILAGIFGFIGLLVLIGGIWWGLRVWRDPDDRALRGIKNFKRDKRKREKVALKQAIEEKESGLPHSITGGENTNGKGLVVR